MKHRVYGHTLGCRLNSYETEAILEEFRRRCSISRVSEPGEASILIVNSCAVTGRSTARSRKAVRHFRRITDALIVVTGCVAQVSPEEFDSNDVIVLPNTDKCNIVSNIAELLQIECSTGSLEDTPPGTLYPGDAPTIMSRTRACLKVQDGCDNACTYCIVPAARGSSRSQPREIVLRQADDLASAGYRELLLTGVDLVRYGMDLYSSDYGLASLARDILKGCDCRVRFSSMEPIGLTQDFLRRIALPGVCRHLHIPIQSGSDRILSSMGRDYTRIEMEELLNLALKLFPGLSLGADIMVGFPGETDQDFAMTLELLSHEAFSYLHVFPFSPRPGTLAAERRSEMPHTEVVTERAETLRALSCTMRRKFRESNIGEKVLALVEGRKHEDTGRYIGMTDNYIPVIVPSGREEGEIVELTLSRDNICWGRR